MLLHSQLMISHLSCDLSEDKCLFLCLYFTSRRQQCLEITIEDEGH